MILPRRPLALLLLAAILASLSGCAALELGGMPSLTATTDALEKKLAFARICEHHGEPDQARAVYESVLEKDPTNRVAEHRLGVLAAKDGDHDEAIRRLLKAREMGEPTAELLNDLGYAYYLQDQLGEAETALREAVQRAPHFKPAWTNLGLVLGEREEFNESFAAFAHAGTPAEAHCSLGYVYAQHGRLREAQSEFEQSVSLDGNLHPAVEGLLQVSSKIPGQQPVTVVSTTRHKTAAEPAPPAGAADTEATSTAVDAAARGADQAGVPFSWPADAQSAASPGGTFKR